MCPHATTTTVAWLYGEASGSHALHVAACPDCTEVAEEHADVASALAPVLPVLRPVAPRRRRWVAALALAAAVALAAGYGAWRIWPGDPPPVVAATAPDRFDADLDDLDLDVTSLELELL